MDSKFLPLSGSKIDFLTRYHRITTERQIRSAGKIIFVYRDPIDRVTSLFKNKIIMRDRSTGIENNINSTVNINIDDLSMSLSKPRVHRCPTNLYMT